LIVIYENEKNVVVYDTARELGARNYINYDYISEWGVVKEENYIPLEIDVHHDQGNVFFLRVIGKVIIISVEDLVARLVGAFDIPELTGGVFKGHLTSDSYIWIGSNENVTSFSTQNLVVVTKLFDYQTFGYEFENFGANTNKHCVSNSSGLIYILGVDELKTTNILVYRSHSQNIKTLYKVI
jgi:hypothetical protein